MFRKEIEIKLKIDDAERAMEEIEKMGGIREKDLFFEDNLLFDYRDLSLQEKGIVLRIREYAGECTLTMKKKEKRDEGSAYKIRSEIETRVSDSQTLIAILKSLNLKAVYRYQKYRAEYLWGNLHVSIDRTPIGDFIELEGSEEEIDSAARSLGFSKADYINVSYRTFHLAYLRERGLPASDLLFPEGTRK
ncbi:MAG: class IV adenylate cyclase [Acidobacteriota bacterium]